MAPIRESIEIARKPEDVAAYIDDLSRHGEWQEEILDVHVETDGPTRVGSRSRERRQMGLMKGTATYEVTEHEPGKVFAFRGVDGPVRVVGRGTLEALDNGERTRVNLELDFTGHGIGVLFAPMARSHARKEVPKSQQRLKERLESGAV
jgi:uncharacterized membrane protein